MSVMKCDRKGCENTNCQRHSNEHGYLCNNCFNELIKYGPTVDVRLFMGSMIPNIESARARFNIEFPKGEHE